MISLLLRPFALSILLQVTTHHFATKDRDDSYDPALDNFQEWDNPDFEEVLDDDELPPLFVRPEILLPLI